MDKGTHFQTSDGEKFYQKSDARNHANTLTDKSVTPVDAVTGEVMEAAEATEGTNAKGDTADFNPIVNPTAATAALMKVLSEAGLNTNPASDQLQTSEGTGEKMEGIEAKLGEINELTVVGAEEVKAAPAPVEPAVKATTTKMTTAKKPAAKKAAAKKPSVKKAATPPAETPAGDAPGAADNTTDNTAK